MPTVLVIDDNPSVGTALELLFSLHDIDVVHADGPEPGLEVLGRGGIDLVIQDMNSTPTPLPGTKAWRCSARSAPGTRTCR